MKFTYIDNHGRKATVDMDKYNADTGAYIRATGGDPFKVRDRNNRIATVDPKQWNDSTASWMQNNVYKDHAHPYDVDAPFFSKTGLKERGYELTHPEKGALARTALGVGEMVTKTAKMIPYLLSKLGTEENQKNTAESIMRTDKYFNEQFQKFGGRDVYSGIGAFIPDALLIALSGGTAGVIKASLGKFGLNRLAVEVGKKALRNETDDVIRSFVLKELAKDATLGNLDDISRQALLKTYQII